MSVLSRVGVFADAVDSFREHGAGEWFGLP
jgi:hypothetical protein